ncbi:Kinesin-like protein KIF19 [Bienertia sinuspersici]
MMIYTDSNAYGPFGTANRATVMKSFSTPQPLDGTITGFFASYGPYLASLGISANHGPYGRT